MEILVIVWLISMVVNSLTMVLSYQFDRIEYDKQFVGAMPYVFILLGPIVLAISLFFAVKRMYVVIFS